MAERDCKKQGDADWQEHQALERELDAALAKYAWIEPRAGLEERVLANLRVERQKVSRWEFGRWSRAATLLVALMVVVAWLLAWKSGRPRPDNTAQRPSTTTLGSPPGPQAVSRGEQNAVRRHRPIIVRRPSLGSAHVPVMVAAEPKLEQFPSPRPLSDQEKILASYVAKYPQDATLIAQARADAVRRDAAEQLKTAQGGRED